MRISPDKTAVLVSTVGDALSVDGQRKQRDLPR
jgi:hypothetical protein